MELTVYVLHGHWETAEERGTTVVCTEVCEREVIKKLEEIVSDKGKAYCTLCEEKLEVEQTDTMFEMKDMRNGGFVGFYITEQHIKLSESLMGEISREMEKIDRTRDIKEYLQGMYESENLEPWKHEYINAKPEVIEEIRLMFEKYEDCNTSFNATMESVIEKYVKEMILNDEKLEFLWEQFGDVLIDDEECILDDFVGFECGTHREEVWHWFDKHHSKGVAALMFGGD